MKFERNHQITADTDTGGYNVVRRRAPGGIQHRFFGIDTKPLEPVLVCDPGDLFKKQRNRLLRKQEFVDSPFLFSPPVLFFGSGHLHGLCVSLLAFDFLPEPVHCGAVAVEVIDQVDGEGKRQDEPHEKLENAALLSCE